MAQKAGSAAVGLAALVLSLGGCRSHANDFYVNDESGWHWVSREEFSPQVLPSRSARAVECGLRFGQFAVWGDSMLPLDSGRARQGDLTPGFLRWQNEACQEDHGKIQVWGDDLAKGNLRGLVSRAPGITVSGRLSWNEAVGIHLARYEIMAEPGVEVCQVVPEVVSVGDSFDPESGSGLESYMAMTGVERSESIFVAGDELLRVYQSRCWATHAQMALVRVRFRKDGLVRDLVAPIGYSRLGGYQVMPGDLYRFVNPNDATVKSIVSALEARWQVSHASSLSKVNDLVGVVYSSLQCLDDHRWQGFGPNGFRAAGRPIVPPGELLHAGRGDYNDGIVLLGSLLEAAGFETYVAETREDAHLLVNMGSEAREMHEYLDRVLCTASAAPGCFLPLSLKGLYSANRCVKEERGLELAVETGDYFQWLSTIQLHPSETTTRRVRPEAVIASPLSRVLVDFSDRAQGR